MTRRSQRNALRLALQPQPSTASEQRVLATFFVPRPAGDPAAVIDLAARRRA